MTSDKVYTVPGKCISWIVRKRTLELYIKLDFKKYEEGKYILPPQNFPKCNHWHFEFNNDVLFKAYWDIRRLRGKFHLINSIIENISPYALSYTKKMPLAVKPKESAENDEKNEEKEIDVEIDVEMDEENAPLLNNSFS